MGKPVEFEAGRSADEAPARPLRRPNARAAVRGPKALADVREELEALFGRPVSPLVFSGISAIDDAEAAARVLRNLIRLGTLGVDDYVQGSLFADAVGVHRNTMSKALKQLAGEGLLINRQGRPARIVGIQPTLPPASRTSAMISHTRIAREQDFEISTAHWDAWSCPLSEVEEGPRVRVAHRLNLSDKDEVIRFWRIRMLRDEAHDWFPAVAEMGFFAAKRAPAFFEEGLAEVVRSGSICDYLREHAINTVNSEYLVRIAELHTRFVESWAELAKTTVKEVKRARFLRLESTTHGPLGPLEYSVAYAAEKVYVVSGADLDVAIRGEALPVATTSGFVRPSPVQRSVR